MVTGSFILKIFNSLILSWPQEEGHSRVAECTRLSPEGGYSGSASYPSDLLMGQEHKNARGFRVVRAAGA